MGRDDTNPVRTIETEAGRLVGTVDRVERRVVWTLDCPDGCGIRIPMTEEMLTGHERPNCACGWSAPVLSPLATEGQPRFFEYNAVLETVPPQAKAAVA